MTTESLLSRYRWGCPKPGCTHLTTFRLHRGQIDFTTQPYCPFHPDQPLIPLIQAVELMQGAKFCFIFNRILFIPQEFHPFFLSLDQETLSRLYQLWVFAGIQVRSNPDWVAIFDTICENQYQMPVTRFGIWGDRRLKTQLEKLLTQRLREIQGQFAKGIVDRTQKLIDLKDLFHSSPISLDPLQQGFNAYWMTRTTQLQEYARSGATLNQLNNSDALTIIQNYLVALTAQQLGLTVPFSIIHSLKDMIQRNELNTLLFDKPELTAEELWAEIRTLRHRSFNHITPPFLSQNHTPSHSSDGLIQGHPILSLNSPTIIDNQLSMFMTRSTTQPPHPNDPLSRSYPMGYRAVLPEGLFEDITDPTLRQATIRAAKGVLQRTCANYTLNYSRIVDSLCVQFAPNVVANPSLLQQHYGNLRSLTNTSANIADSAHYLLYTAGKGYFDLEDKLTRFDQYLHQDRFLVNIAGWLFTGFCGRYILTTLSAEWRVSTDWIKDLLRGWRSRADLILATTFNRKQHRMAIGEFWTQLTTQCSLTPEFQKQGRHNGWFELYCQPNESLIDEIIPHLHQAEAHRSFQQFRRQWTNNTDLSQYLTLLTPNPTTWFTFSRTELTFAGNQLLRLLSTAITQMEARGGNAQNLRAQKNKLDRLLMSPLALSYLSDFLVIDPSYRACKTISCGLTRILGSAKWVGTVVQLYAMAACLHYYPQLTTLPHLTASDFLTIPFYSDHRKKTTGTITCTSPNYIFLRENGAQITTHLRDPTHCAFEFELARKPLTKDRFIQANSTLLSSNHQTKIVDEISWGTSNDSFRRNIRGRLQSDPFFLSLVGVPLSQLSTTQRRQLDQNPVLRDRVRQSHITMQVVVPRGVLDRIRSGASVQQILVKPPMKPAKNGMLILQLQGPRTAFERPPKRAVVRYSGSSRPVKIGVDTNNPAGVYPFEFAGLDTQNREVPLVLPTTVQQDLGKFAVWSRKLGAIEKQIKALQSKLQRFPHGLGVLRWKEEIRLLHNRRAGLKKQIDAHAAWILYEVAQIYQPLGLGIEDLHTLRTRGKRGNLAKIVNYMVKRQTPILDRIAAWCRAKEVPNLIQMVDPRHTSHHHFGCRGSIVRLRQNDQGQCQHCGQTVVLHHNAALNIAFKVS